MLSFEPFEVIESCGTWLVTEESLICSSILSAKVNSTILKKTTLIKITADATTDDNSHVINFAV